MLSATDTSPNREYLSLDEAAAYTGMSQRAILRGELPTYMAGGKWRIPTAAAHAYLDWRSDGLSSDHAGRLRAPV